MKENAARTARGSQDIAATVLREPIISWVGLDVSTKKVNITHLPALRAG